MKYRAEIDGLRALAVVPVILFHAGSEWFSGGFVGVDVFFVISGYLITTILIEDIENNRFSIISFYERRARRILPALYLVILTTSIASCFILYPDYLISFARSLISSIFFVANFYFWTERGYFGVSSELKPLIHLWSLAIEEQFYIIFPFVLLLFKKFKKTFYSLFVMGILLSVTSSYYVTDIHFDTAFYFPVTRAWELLFGSVAALILRNSSFHISFWKAEIITFIGLLLIFYSYFSFDQSTIFPGGSALIPVCGAFLFIIAASFSKYLKTIFSLKPIVFIGLLSFSLYLWHQPLFSLTRHLSLFEENFISILLFTLLLSYLTYRYVEAPFRNNPGLSGRKVLFTSLISGFFLILVGVCILFNNGFSSRYPISEKVILEQLSDYKSYNQRVFDSLDMKPFADNAQPRVVIVGDSYAKDLVNIIYESSLFSGVQFSTRQVNSECGNLYLDDYTMIESYIPPNRLARCKVMGWYLDKEFLKIIEAADEVWLAASWQKWVIDQLPKSIANLSDDFGVRVRVFGVKNFGDISPYDLLDVPPDKRPDYAQAVSAEAIKNSNYLQERLSEYELFHSLLQPLCDGDYTNCKIFTDDGLLVSADGGLISRAGAFEAGERIKKLLNNILVSLHR